MMMRQQRECKVSIKTGRGFIKFINPPPLYHRLDTPKERERKERWNLIVMWFAHAPPTNVVMNEVC
jgi:hypothetical protein